MRNVTANTHHTFTPTTTIFRFMQENQCPNLVVRSDATYAGDGAFLAVAGPGGAKAIGLITQDAFYRVDLESNSDNKSDSDFILDSEGVHGSIHIQSIGWQGQHGGRLDQQ